MPTPKFLTNWRALLSYSVYSRSYFKQIFHRRPKYNTTYYTLLSIFSDLARLIRLTYPYYFLHQSQHLHTRPLTTLINDSSQLSLYHNSCYTFFLLHCFHQACTHPSSSKMTRDKYLFFPFQIIRIINHANKRLHLFLSYLYINKYIYIYRNLAFFVTCSLMPTSLLQKPSPPKYKIFPELCITYFRRTHPYYTKPRIPPILHNITSITLHTSNWNSIKTHHLPQFTSLFRQTHLRHPMSMWVKPEKSTTAMWGQSETSMAMWLHSILTEYMEAPGRSLLLK